MIAFRRRNGEIMCDHSSQEHELPHLSHFETRHKAFINNGLEKTARGENFSIAFGIANAVVAVPNNAFLKEAIPFRVEDFTSIQHRPRKGEQGAGIVAVAGGKECGV